MRRRVALALFTVLAVVAMPGAATALTHRETTGGQAAGITLANRHATVVHVGVAARRGHERRAPQGSGAPLGVLERSVDASPASARADLASRSSSPTGELPSSSRPRAPPSVV